MNSSIAFAPINPCEMSNIFQEELWPPKVAQQPALTVSPKWAKTGHRGTFAAQLQEQDECIVALARGSCLKTGQHLFFVIIYLLLPIKCIIFYSVSKILFNFFIANM